LHNTIAMVGEKGEKINIIYPGRENTDRGADYRDAVIISNGEVLKGDIEVHRKTSDWRAHGHHEDAIYNRVVLHVVMWNDSNTTTTLQDGRKVTTISLNRYWKEADRLRRDVFSLPATRTMPCYGVTNNIGEDHAGYLLEVAGRLRFFNKVNGFRDSIKHVGAGQALYRGIMSALGYSKNKLPFIKLAELIPLKSLEQIGKCTGLTDNRLARIQSLLMGSAGLLPSQRWGNERYYQRSTAWVTQLERYWDTSRYIEPVPINLWNLFRIRPGNSPVRRIAAMSYLILRNNGTGMLRMVTDALREVSVTNSWKDLEKKLIVTTDGYWAHHLDFNVPGTREYPTLLGRTRASDIVVNIFLPFFYAWGRHNTFTDVESVALKAYSEYPRLTVNTIETHMRAQCGLPRNMVARAIRQQGLLHIYNSYCSNGYCSRCPLAKFKPGYHVEV